MPTDFAWSELAAEMANPNREWKTVNRTSFYTFFGLVFAPLFSAIGFGVYGNYQPAQWCFGASWLFTTIAALIGFSGFSRRARFIWSAVVSLVSGILFLVLYFVVCPTLTISPSSATFSTIGQLYTFRVENRSDHDTYMNSFVFYFDSSAYSEKDFDFQISEGSLKPLAQQLDGVYWELPDMAAEVGFVPESSNTHFFLLHVYRLKAHESREFSIRWQHYEISTVQTVDVTSEVMSHSDKPVPVDKYGGSVYVPALITRPLNVTGFLICYFKDKQRVPCDVQPIHLGVSKLPIGCVWLAALSERETVANASLPGKCDP